MTQQPNERARAATAFVVANDRRVRVQGKGLFGDATRLTDNAEAAWQSLLRQCGGDMGIALHEAEAALRRGKEGAS